MVQYDEDALTDRFEEVVLSYTDKFRNTVVMGPESRLMQNAPHRDVDETKPWVRFTISPGASEQITTSERSTFVQIGIATLQVFAPRGTFMYVTGGIRDQFINAFRTWDSPDKAVRTYRTSYDTIDDTSKAYVQVNANVFWESKRAYA